ncbi:predicted protein [Naegleria gruberi]|uniref:Predicted protein n=1 Tax=Naegleria gruberi TaxID=5762 RepID=D2UX57_NAEGR|nr:uncharacterized protein NAEGRDRAFT_61644 [Naegleria gruberi]EFC50567.1 predicted protein [Naegleria gruberi]|eukprot:XP_002683311.1 predicted protein [Naegleria gruberi strain NEG-M]
MFALTSSPIPTSNGTISHLVNLTNVKTSTHILCVPDYTSSSTTSQNSDEYVSILKRSNNRTRKSLILDEDSTSSSNEDEGKSRMRSVDLKNTFTTSHQSQIIRCNRTSANQKSYICYDDIKKHFFLPEGEAAKRLGCSKSKLKRIKTRLNIERWPYRRIQSLLNQKSSSNKENSRLIDLAVDFVLNYPNLITKYSNDDISLIAKRFDRVKISNLL